MYLRPTARLYWGPEVRIGDTTSQTPEPGSSGLAGLLGATVLFAGDDQGVGYTSLTAGMFVGRADTSSLGRVTFWAPTLLVGFDFSPHMLLYCWLMDDKCQYHFRGIKN